MEDEFCPKPTINRIFYVFMSSSSTCEILAREFQNNKTTLKHNLNRTKLFKLQSRSQTATASTDRTRHPRKYQFSSPDLGKKGNICFRQRIRYKRPPKFLSSRKTKLLPAIPLRPALIRFPRRQPPQFLQV